MLTDSNTESKYFQSPKIEEKNFFGDSNKKVEAVDNELKLEQELIRKLPQ